MGGVLPGQRTFEWTGDLRWDELPAPLRGEVRAVLRDLLRRAARGDGHGESGHDE